MSQDVPARRSILLGTGLLWGVGAIVAAQAVSWSGGFFHDDAYITLRYAQNWLAGNGIGWNPGDRVEGYTNFLQLLLATGLGALGMDLVRAAQAIGAASWLGLALFAIGRCERSVRGAWLVSLPGVAAGASASLIAWTFGGLEAPLFALLVTAGVVWLGDALSRRDVSDGGPRRRLAWSGAAFALACLTRMDAALFVAVAAVFWIATRRDRMSDLLAFAAPLAVVLLPWLVWKQAYYGALLPNTWWVKGTGLTAWRLADGLAYAAAFLATPPFPVIWLFAGAVRAWMRRRLEAADGFGLAVVATQLAWVVYVGGDQMPASRLLVPLVPVSAWLALRLWRPDLDALGSRGVVGASVAVASCVALQLAWPIAAEPLRNATAFMGAAVGRHAAEHFRPGALVALNTAGSTPFHAPGLRYVDMLGLNDAHIARRQVGEPRVAGQRMPGHRKGDGAYVLAQRPDYLILGPAHGARKDEPWFLSDLEIAQNPSFLRDYRLRVTRIDVRDQSGFEEVPAARSGSFPFTYYERVR